MMKNLRKRGFMKIVKMILIVQVYFLSSAYLFPRLLTVTPINQRALTYSGETNPEVGNVQLGLLLQEGLLEKSYVLEIGCGSLIAAIPIMWFLEDGHYVGIEPNNWQIEQSLQVKENREVANQKRPMFLKNENFDATAVPIKFDYIIAHSIISHAPLRQFKLFLKNCAAVLNEGGKVVFSLRLTHPNEWDNSGIKAESTTDVWQYPGNTFFDQETVIVESLKWFKKVEYKKINTQLIMAADKTAFHDWFTLTK